MTVITNAALVIFWCSGLGATRVEYIGRSEWSVPSNRAEIAFSDDAKVEPVATNYLRSGYDRGHLAPAADFTASRTNLEATYLMSNISPMFPVFNRGRWAKVECMARALVRKCGEARVVTIPVYGDTTNRCGALTVPTAFVKEVYTGDVCIAAWCEQNKNEGTCIKLPMHKNSDAIIVR